MKTITTKYYGPTIVKGARIKATDHDGNTVWVSYPHEARNAHEAAARQFCAIRDWHGTLANGWQAPGVEVWVFVDGNTIEV